MAHDVFISHSAKDKTIADAVCATLESEGIRCWIAPRDVMPGMEWGRSIIEGIEQARIMVLLFTANANASPQIRREVERAVNHDVVILPLRIENILPDKSLEYFIGNVHWLDALTPPLETHLERLARTTKAFLSQMQPKEVQPAPPETSGPSLTGPLAVAPREMEIVGPDQVPEGKLGTAEPPAADRETTTHIVEAPRRAASTAAGVTGGETVDEESPHAADQVRDRAKSADFPFELPQPEASASPAARPFESGGPGKGSQAANVAAKKPLRVRAWAWGGAITLALVLAVFFAVRSDREPAPAVRPPAVRPPVAGAIWTARDSGTTMSLLWIFGTSHGKRMWAVGEKGTIVESDDGGATWVGRTSGANIFLESIFGTNDGERLWAVGELGTVLESDNGGATWAARDTPTAFTLYSIFGTSDGERLWAAGGKGTFLESDDGGASWTRCDSGTNQDLHGIFVGSDDEHLWTVGNHGTILGSDDGGVTWTTRKITFVPIHSDAANDLFSISGTGDGKHLWAVGQFDTILVSDDGGATWAGREPITSKALKSIFGTSDGRALWAVGQDGYIEESEDGGATWSERTSGTKSWLHSVFGTNDGSHLWVVGESGTILESNGSD